MTNAWMVGAVAAWVCVSPVSSSVTLDELRERPDWLPQIVTAMDTFNFGGGDTIAAGTELRVVSFDANGVTLDTGKFVFNCRPEQTDLLARATALVGSFTPEQRELAPAIVLADSTLWPTEVALNTGMEFSNGARIEAGAELPLRTVNRDQLEVYSADAGSMFTVDASDTDFMRRARERVLLPADERRPHFVRAIEASLSASGPNDLSKADYLLLYRGSAACSRCKRFSPKLVKAYERLRREHENFEVVFLSEDRSEREFDAHLRDRQYPFAVVEYDKLYAAADARTRGGGLMPIVYLVLPDGSVIDHTDANGSGRSAEDVLNRLERELVR